MTLYTNRLRLALQETGENDGTWGDVVNNGVTQLLEDSISGRVSIVANSSPRTLTTANGANDEARYMILAVTGSPGVTLTLNIPGQSKIYLVDNQLSGGFDISIGVSGGVRAVVANGITAFVWTDGTNTYSIETENAVNATNATTATNATQLGGVPAALFARLDVQQGFTRSQNTGRSTLTASAGNVAVNAALSNSFRLLMAGNYTMSAPTSAVNGTVIRFYIKQDATGTRTLAWNAIYKFPGGVAPTLSTAPNAVDLAAFEFEQTDNIWIGNLIKDLR